MNFSRPIRTSTALDADEHRLVWAVYPADRTTPVQTFERLRATGHHAALLESVEGPERLARYSFVAVDPDGSLRAGSTSAMLTDASGRGETLDLPPHEALREASARRRRDQPAAGHPDLPPFQGGWLGLFSYEWAATLEPRVPRPEQRDFDLPEALFDHYPDVVAFDHSAQTCTVLCAAPRGAADRAEAEGRAARIAADMGASNELSGSIDRGFRLLDQEPRSLTERSDFLRGVDRLKEAIGQGEIFQAVLSQRFEQRYEGDPFTLYRVLRLVNPAPHMFYFEADGLTLVGSSPERLVSVQDGHLEVVPIAGTRKRGATTAEDERLGAELLADVKECAEHDMLVDLARNDAGRVARIGTVEVEQYRQLVKFPRVQHLVSRVGAELAPGLDALDALAAAFPAGTVSGAPKVRAMSLVAELEGRERGAYAGAFGYLDRAGQLDVAIAIRTIVCHGGKLHFQAGAGIVFDSDPDKEFEETLHKASALFEAARMATSPAFQPEPAEAPVR
ncbi:Anthranilate synthase component 1 [Planctomycetes bacterium Poly30]|uniref:Anthranilate synthase component 1 n=1 Tax=Saltatorellus ferox TaxID=2528018 RepID=A0A518EV44_9BACT|nr:Anthranilate synthase component 1 [Planctomycetes bacterium Poly30]